MPLTPFMKFWNTINQVLRSHGQPDMLFGEAHAFWADHNAQY